MKQLVLASLLLCALAIVVIACSGEACAQKGPTPTPAPKPTPSPAPKPQPSSAPKSNSSSASQKGSANGSSFRSPNAVPRQPSGMSSSSGYNSYSPRYYQDNSWMWFYFVMMQWDDDENDPDEEDFRSWADSQDDDDLATAEAQYSEELDTGC